MADAAATAAQGNLDASTANGAASDAGHSQEGVNAQVGDSRVCRWLLAIAAQGHLQQLVPYYAGLLPNEIDTWILACNPDVVGSMQCQSTSLTVWRRPCVQEIRRDAFWLQRRVSNAFGSMDAAEAQQLAEKIFATLEVLHHSVAFWHVSDP